MESDFPNLTLWLYSLLVALYTCTFGSFYQGSDNRNTDYMYSPLIATLHSQDTPIESALPSQSTDPKNEHKTQHQTNRTQIQYSSNIR